METPQKLPKLRTWHHLNQRKRPTEYEVVSVKTHWTDNYWDHPFKSLNEGIAVNQWYVKNRVHSPLQIDDWQIFRDPDEVIYRSYTTLELADAAIEALRVDNPDKEVIVDDKGGYIRVSVDGECMLRRATVAECLGRPCRMQEVETVLGSFAGQIETTENYMRFYLSTRL